MVFKLVTSWIPGEDHKGIFRYKFPKLHQGYRSALAEYQIMFKRTYGCAIVVVLYDADGVPLRRVYPVFKPPVTEQMETMSANGNVQMDTSEYTDFIGTPGHVGYWDINSACPGN
jgi:hypothetical protein